MLTRADVHYVIKYRAEQPCRRCTPARLSCPDAVLEMVLYVLNETAGDRLRPAFLKVLRMTSSTNVKTLVPDRVYVLITSLPVHADTVSSSIMTPVRFQQRGRIERRVEHNAYRITTDVTIQNGASTIPWSTRNHCTPREISNSPSC
jgi:hypothetical protein